MNDERKYTASQMRCIDKYRDSQCVDNWWADDIIRTFIGELNTFGIDVSTTRRTFHSKDRDGKPVERVVYDPNVNWSLSYCHSDGASFAADSFTIAEFMDAGATCMAPPPELIDPLPKGATRRSDDYDYLATSDGEVARALRQQLKWCEAQFSTWRLHGRAWRALTEASVCLRVTGRNRDTSSNMVVDEFDEGAMTDYDNDDPVVAQKMDALYSIIFSSKDTWQDFLRQLADALHSSLEAEYEHQTSNDAVWDMIASNDLFTPDDEDVDEDEEVETALAA